MEKRFTVLQKWLYTLGGALLFGVLWRIRGTHGWGGGWGMFTAGMVFMLYMYAVFARKSNASFLHVVCASTAALFTAPAWGPILNQPSGLIDNALKDGLYETTAVSPWSGVFMMLCLGFGTLPLYLFFVSRLFSGRRYSVWKYIAVIAVFFGAAYLCQATVSHGIVRLIQPQSVAAFEGGLRANGIEDSAYAAYMKHFADIGWGKKIAYGRNYFSEIEIVSRALAALTAAAVVRFAFRDRAGGKILFWGCAAFSVSITAANVFFVLNHRFPETAFPWLDSAWSFWEFFTGFFAGLLLMLLLFYADRRCPDAETEDALLPAMPTKLSDVLLCVFVFLFGFGASLLRPVAVRMDASDVLPVVVYAVGGVLLLLFAVLMLTGKLPKFWRRNPVPSAPRLTAVLLAVHAAYYFLVGYGDCPAALFENTPVRTLMLIACPLFFAVFLPARRMNTAHKILPCG